MDELEREIETMNGFDTVQLGGLINTLKDNPENGNVTFHCRTQWQHGARAFHHFSGYQIDGQLMHQDEREFVVLSDEPAEFGVSDAAPAPAEQLLGAVAGCITATTNAFASLNEIRLSNLEVAVSGVINLQGMFGLQNNVPIGFKSMEVNVDIAGDASESKLLEMVESGFNFSPMRNTVSQGTAIALNVQIGA